MSEAAFLARFDVSRETLDRLRLYSDLLRRWNARINLVSPSTLEDIWSRHFADSAQLWPLIPEQARIATDLGSGAGFPALVLASLARESDRPLHYHLVESDGRKCAFLSTIARELGLAVTIHQRRAEFADLPFADLLTARAFTSLPDLIANTWRLRHVGGTALFPKGRTVHKELDAAARLWDFDYRLHPSLTDPEASVVEIGAINGPTADNSRPG